MAEMMTIESPLGQIYTNIATYYESGALKEAEPVEPVFYKNETGLFMIVDNTPLRDEDHERSLILNEDGSVRSCRTVATAIIAVPLDPEEKKAGRIFIAADWRDDPRETGAKVLVPIRIVFSEHGLEVTDSDGKVFDLAFDRYDVQVDYMLDNIVMGSGCGDCSTCNGQCQL